MNTLMFGLIILGIIAIIMLIWVNTTDNFKNKEAD